MNLMFSFLLLVLPAFTAFASEENMVHNLPQIESDVGSLSAINTHIRQSANLLKRLLALGKYLPKMSCYKDRLRKNWNKGELLSADDIFKANELCDENQWCTGIYQENSDEDYYLCRKKFNPQACLRDTCGDFIIMTKPVDYILIDNKQCSDYGFKIITTLDECTEAKRYIEGYPEYYAIEESGGNSDKPPGCYNSWSWNTKFNTGIPNTGKCSHDIKCLCNAKDINTVQNELELGNTFAEIDLAASNKDMILENMVHNLPQIESDVGSLSAINQHIRQSANLLKRLLALGKYVPKMGCDKDRLRTDWTEGELISADDIFKANELCDENKWCKGIYKKESDDNYYLCRNRFHPQACLRDNCGDFIIVTKPVDYILIDSKQCSDYGFKMITTLDECREAYAYIEVSRDNRPNDESDWGYIGGASNRPPGCYVEQSWSSKFNSGIPNTGDCSHSIKCLCNTKDVTVQNELELGNTFAEIDLATSNENMILDIPVGNSFEVESKSNMLNMNYTSVFGAIAILAVLVCYLNSSRKNKEKKMHLLMVGEEEI